MVIILILNNNSKRYLNISLIKIIKFLIISMQLNKKLSLKQISKINLYLFFTLVVVNQLLDRIFNFSIHNIKLSIQTTVNKL